MTAKTITTVIFFALLPYIIICALWLLSGLSFDIREVFQNGTFWAIAIFYSIFYLIGIKAWLSENK